MCYENMYNYEHKKHKWNKNMNTAIEMTEDKAFTEDVKKMSYEDLMSAIRYLDHERQIISNPVHEAANKIEKDKEILKRAA